MKLCVIASLLASQFMLSHGLPNGCTLTSKKSNDEAEPCGTMQIGGLMEE